MVEVKPVVIGNHTFVSIEVDLPKTTLLVIQTEIGYVMCGALDIELLRTKLQSRDIIAARAVGVRTIEDLLNGTVESCTQAASRLGVVPEMSIRDALLRMAKPVDANPSPVYSSATVTLPATQLIEANRPLVDGV